jgi:DNA-binding winged helix-turn-helix (wHTH) protein/tetratricopeptide (TPR) repeat protein
VYQFGQFILDPTRRVLRKGSEIVPLTLKAAEVLGVLVERAGEVVTKDELMIRVWPDTFVEEANLSVQVSALRKALGDQEDGRPFIETLPRRGYRFLGRVSASTPPSPRSLAVLPFRHLEPRSSEEHLGLGMADALITRIGAIGRLLIRPTSAVAKYAAVDRDPQQLARELNVDLVLEGRIQHEADRIRLTIQLVRAADGATLWAEVLEEAATRVFALQDVLAERLAQALTLQLGESESAALRKAATEHPAAFDAYLRGRYFWNKLTDVWLVKARAAFEEAIAHDPSYARAHAGLADTHIALGLYEIVDPAEAWPRAREAAHRAIACDASLADAHVALAYSVLFQAWDWTTAERELRLALELSPRSAMPHLWHALFLGMQGRFMEAMRAALRAREIDPLSLTVNTVLGLQFYLARQSDEEIEQHRKTLELEPEFAIGHWALGLALHQKKRYAEAIAAQEKAVTLCGESVAMKTVLGRYYALAGRTDDALRILAECSRIPWVSSYRLATIHSALGESDQAFELLQNALRKKDHWMVWLKVDPMLADLRSDPRFVALRSALDTSAS